MEEALHRRHDEAMAKMNAARQAFFVFSKAIKPQDRETLMMRLRA